MLLIYEPINGNKNHVSLQSLQHLQRRDGRPRETLQATDGTGRFWLLGILANQTLGRESVKCADKRLGMEEEHRRRVFLSESIE